MRTMYDAVTPENIPINATMVAAYIDGKYTNYDRVLTLFPHATIVTIATKTTGVADVLDCEKGDATPAQCPAWAVRMRQLGRVPTVYCSRSAWNSVRAAFITQHVPEPQYGIAHYDNVAELITGAIYKQYGGVKDKYDLNAVADYWPGIDPIAQPIDEDDMKTTDLVNFGPTPQGGTPQQETAGDALGNISYQVESMSNNLKTTNDLLRQVIQLLTAKPE